MCTKWIKVNSRLLDGVTLINALTTKKFKLLLSHIINANGEQLFTEEEQAKLKESLKLTDDNLHLLIQSISYILKQSSKVILKPTVLQKQLCEDLKFDTEKAEEFVKLWSSEAKEDLGDLENRMRLEGIAWELNIRTADQISNRQSMPVARVQFDLSKAVDNNVKDNIVLELDKEELLHLYSTLENVQIKLDNIQSVGK